MSNVSREIHLLHDALHGSLAMMTLFYFDGVFVPENPEEPHLQENEELPNQHPYHQHLDSATGWYVPSKRILGGGQAVH